MSKEYTLTKGSEEYKAFKAQKYPTSPNHVFDNLMATYAAADISPYSDAFHIIPIKKKTGEKDARGYDVYTDDGQIIAGIGFYRIVAHRTGMYAGINEPIFGPDKVYELSGQKFTVPEYCTVTVKRVVQGSICEFVAKEYWIENYEKGGEKGADNKWSKTDKPNTMWNDRKYGQLSKCAEAQALRKAFPEVGSQPTYEEMVGKELVDFKYVAPIDPKLQATVVQAKIDSPKVPKVPKAPKVEVEIDAPLELENLSEVRGDYVIDGDLCTALEVYGTTAQRIRNVKSIEDEPEYQEWKKDNGAELKRFFNENPNDGAILGDMWKAKIAELQGGV